MKLNKIIIFIYLFLIMMMPDGWNFMGISYAKIIVVFNFLLTFFLLWKNKKNLRDIWTKFKKSFYFYLCIGILIFTSSVFISTLVYDISVKYFFLSDYFEIMRGILYILFIFNLYVLCNDNDDIRYFANKSIIILLLLQAFIAFTQYFNFFNINSLYVKYIASTQYEGLLNPNKIHRVVGLTYNPNILGCFLIVGLSIIFKNIFEFKSNKSFIINLLFYIFIRVITYLTFSRTAFILGVALDFIFIVFCLFEAIIKNKKKDIKKRVILTSLLIVIIEIGIFVTLPNNITWRLKQLFNGENMTSWEQRIENTDNILGEITGNENNKLEDNNENNDKLSSKYNNLFIGVGAHKEYHTPTTGENEWVMILYKYGILGIVTYLVIYFLPLIRFKKIDFMSRIIYVSLMAIIFIYMIPAGYYHVYKLFLLALIVLGFNIKELKE